MNQADTLLGKKLMKRILLLTALFPLALSAQAGPYGNDLSKCLISSTSASDKELLVEWIFYAIALNPKVKPMTDIPPARREEIDKRVGKTFERLVTDSCLVQTQQAVKYEGTQSINESFRLLGQVAAQEMFANPEVAKGVQNFTKYVDIDRMNKALTPAR